VYTIEKRSGQVKVDVVNIGMHPIYVESVSVEVPCELRKEERSSTPEDCQYYLVPIYKREPSKSNEPIKPLDAGGEASYAERSWDFSQYPLQKWLESKELDDELPWVDVKTTKKEFRLRPMSTWYEIHKGKDLVIPNATAVGVIASPQ
jgi:hypothetical protein